MIETTPTTAHAKAFDTAHRARARILVDLVRAVFSNPSAARFFGIVTTEEGAGRAQPAPCKSCG